MLGLKQRGELTAINIINAVLAVILFFSPWLVGFRDVQIATWNAGVCGLAIGLMAAFALTKLQSGRNGATPCSASGRPRHLGFWALPVPWRPCGPMCW